jgi:hypothetical protein
MTTATGLAIGLLLAGLLTSPGHVAAQTPRACGLLSAADVGAVVGGTVASPQESNLVVPEGPSKGETIGLCTWAAGTDTSVTVAVARATPGARRDAALGQLRQVVQTLKSQGWTEQSRDFPNGTCVVMTPPAGTAGLPSSTGCFAEAKGVGLSVGYNGSASLSMDRAKTLLDKAIGRLP